MRRGVLLEVAVESLEDALAAVAGGADRLELSAALHLDGLTPDRDVLRSIRERVSTPVAVMVRPRAGNFVYEECDVDAMLAAIEALRARGAEAMVFGALTDEGRIDRRLCRRLLDRCGDGECVFHRAFDVVADPLEALQELIDLGFERVLTSGGGETAASPDGLRGLAALVERAAERIEILAGGGIRAENVAAVVRATGCRQIHSSCRSRIGSAVAASRDARTDTQAVAALRRALDALA